MSDIFDYIKNYGNIEFTEKCLNDIDNVIFSRLAFIDYDDFDSKTLKDVSESNFNLTKCKGDSQTTEYTKKLLTIIAKTKRYSNIVIENYVNEVGSNNSYAFCAVTFRITKNISYIAFRGTDDSIAGIYEDIAMCCQFPVGSQVRAFDYLNNHCKNTKDCFYIGGYSKGGNLALFSFVFSNQKTKDRTIRVYNNDGPGFPKEYAYLYSKDEISEKLRFIAPKDSIVGRLLFSKTNYKIVESGSHLIHQHNVFKWKTDDDSFKEALDFSNASNFLDDLIKSSHSLISKNELSTVNTFTHSVITKCNLNTKDDMNISTLYLVAAVTFEKNNMILIRGLMKNVTKAIGKGLRVTITNSI